MNIIFHMPENFMAGNSAGPTVRPRRFLKAFKDKGYNIFVIAGTLEDRVDQLRKLSQDIAAGKTFDFMYSESSSYPTLWTETKKSLFGPKVDYRLFKLCKKNGIPVGLYLRDIYWISQQFKSESSTMKRLVFTVLHELDLWMYKKHAQILYLQSSLMGKHLPHSQWFNIGVLPPGIETCLPKSAKPTAGSNQRLKLFYVGGIGSHYDMKVLFFALKERVNSVELTLCCRERDYERYYNPYMDLPNVHFIHKDASELGEFVESSDITMLYFHPGEYRKFVMPNKMYEYLGYKKPIITNTNTEAGRFIEENHIGWAIEYDVRTCLNLLDELSSDYREVTNKTQSISRVIEMNSWEKRVEQVVSDLESK